MRYKVSKQYARGPESHFAQFTDLSDAKSFIQTKMEQDVLLNVKVIYKIYEFTELLTEFDSSKPDTTAAGSQGQSSQSQFRPTPLNTSLRPAGMPKNWKDDEEENK